MEQYLKEAERAIDDHFSMMDDRPPAIIEAHNRKLWRAFAFMENGYIAPALQDEANDANLSVVALVQQIVAKSEIQDQRETTRRRLKITIRGETTKLGILTALLTAGVQITSGSPLLKVGE